MGTIGHGCVQIERALLMLERTRCGILQQKKKVVLHSIGCAEECECGGVFVASGRITVHGLRTLHMGQSCGLTVKISSVGTA